ncbi:MAG TPA: RHS repeat-associated core domain-containing protein, partial [Cyclobacteriaceae bacterium]
EPGYAYLYVSNEHPTLVDVYIDDVSITYTPSAIVQMDSYYPFGLQYNSYVRENSVKNKYLYNAGSEIQDDLDLGVYETFYRMLDPADGRWWQVDPMVDEMYSWTPYNYSFNNPILHNDPKGDCPPGIDCEAAAKGIWNAVKGVGEFVANTWNSGGGNIVEAAQNIDALGTIAYGSPEAAADIVVDGAKQNFVDKIQETGSVNGAVSEIAGEAMAGIVLGAITDKGISKITGALGKAEGIIYLRTDKMPGGLKPYVGQAKSAERYAARQAEHARKHPRASFEFQKIDKGKPGKKLDMKEQKALDARGGPTNKSNPNGGTSNKKNIIKKKTKVNE